MTEPFVQIKVHEHAGTIILNRPDKRNALNRRLVAELSQALDDLHLERRVRAVIITGAGSAFCAGLDLGEMLDNKDLPDAYRLWEQDSLAYRNLIRQMLLFPKPLIAAVNGPAVAGGAGLVLAADFAIGARQATIGFPEPARGIVAGMVMPLLTFRIGGGHAAYMLLTAAVLDAERAREMGLLQEVVEHDKLWARAVELAGQCARCAPEALQLTKRMLNETIGEHLETLLNTGTAVSATSRTTEAAHEGLKAFREKRSPKWD